MERIKGNLFRFLPVLIALVLFLIPFFWFKPGQIDWGGDSTRAYYFDPSGYLMHHSLFGVSPSDTGGPVLGYYTIPYVLLLMFVKKIVISHTILISIFHGLKLSVAFLSICYIVKNLVEEKIKKKTDMITVSGIVGGLLYVFSSVAIIGWDKVILTHDQLFLNPLVFLLFLLFFKCNKTIYLLFIILITFFFSQNFSFGSAPPIFSFYPISLVFLLTYAIFVKKWKISWLKLLFAFLLFFLVHAFDFIPVIYSLFETGSDLYVNVFTAQGKFDRGLTYFEGISPSVKLVKGIFLLPQIPDNIITGFYTLIFPFLIVISLILKKSKSLFVVTAFFLIVLYFAIGNITSAGITLYKSFFILPGFSMFRNYYGQWQYTYLFFFVLLSSISYCYVFSSISKKPAYIFSALLIILISINAHSFIKGDLVNKDLWLSNKLKLVDQPDPNFIKATSHIKQITQDAKVLILPLTDPGYQMVLGKERKGVYQGPALIAYLSGKRDFAGLTSFGFFREKLAGAVRAKDLLQFKKILAYYNIGYIFYNSDPFILEKGFPRFPYEDVSTTFPKNQKEYKKFIDSLGYKQVGNFGMYYHLYQVPNMEYLPHIYAATDVISSNDVAESFKLNDESNLRKVYVENRTGVDIGSRQDVFQAKSFNPFTALQLNNHLHNHSPYVVRKPNDMLYPFVLLKEKLDLSKKTELTPHVDTALLLLSKRLFELRYWGNEMAVRAGSSHIQVGSYYMSWERTLERYKRGYSELFSFLDNSRRDKSEINPELVKIDEQLKRHQAQLIDEVHQTKKTEEEKKMLIELVNKTFYSIFDYLSVPVFSTEKNSYSISLPASSNGEYRLTMENIPPLDQGSNTAILEFNHKKYFLKNKSKSTKFIEFPDIPVPSGDLEFSITYARQNFAQNSQLRESRTFTAGELDKSSYQEKIMGYEPEKQYLFTFEYNTYGDNFAYSFLDIKSSGKSRGKNSFFKKNLNSTSWKTEQVIIAADQAALAGYIGFFNNHSPSNAKISIKNLSVTETKVPNVVFVKDIPGKIESPKISFQKINPVSYRISIKDAKEPFLLTFLDTYDKNWKLILRNKDSEIPTKYSYFDGDVTEGPSLHDFPGLDAKVGWFGPYISDDMHMAVNNYANGWFISPKDTGFKKDYELVLVYNRQKLFYIGAIISAVSLLTLIVAMIFLIRRK